MSLSILCIFGLICATHAVWVTPKKQANLDIGEEMEKAGIVPKIIPIAPPNMLQVGLTRGNLIPGLIIDHTDDETGPEVEFEADSSSWHAFFISVIQNWDPEEKLVSRSPNVTKPVYEQEEWHMWTVVNVPGNNISLGEEYYKYQAPQIVGDEEIINLELYLIYRQPGKLEFKRPAELLKPDGELIKTIRDFTEYYNMTGPVAGNFLYRRWEKFNEIFYERVMEK